MSEHNALVSASFPLRQDRPEGLAPEGNQIRSGGARFTLLDSGLLRIEYSPDGSFEDRASFFAYSRRAPQQEFRAWRAEGGALQIETPRLRLSWRPDGRPFHAGNLNVTLLNADGTFFGAWKPGLEPARNLGGTLRTLDECEAEADLGEGVLSRDGWSLKDDSDSVLYDGEAGDWAAPRVSGRLDWYLFAYGLDYDAALRAFRSVSGPVPIPPQWALGSWYSRYWPYRSEDLLGIADDYRRNGFPLDVMVIDMDWHLDGWTGYTWNRGLIPDPQGLLAALHAKGLRTTLNLHPASGVGPHEEAYPAFAAAMGLDPAKGEAVPFDVADPRFMRHYFSLLLHPLERQGVDFWWMDWQQGSASSMPGLDPLTWLNETHFRDRRRADNPAFPGTGSAPKRGMNFSRWAGWGDHRHAIHFSGDTHSNWELLGFLPRFTATAGNLGVAYWSHDLGGHFSAGAGVDWELNLRWLQFGALSPVMRVHSSRDPAVDRRPWLHGDEHTRAARKAYALRARLLPSLYAAARQCHESGLPLLRPMYLAHPHEAKAYESGGQFLLGPDLLAAPVSRPGFGPRKVAHTRVWLPAGDWYHFETHEHFQGPLETVVAAGIDSVPLFARGGAPLFLQDPPDGRVCEPGAPLVVRIYPGAAAARDFYEDDGESEDYLRGGYRKTLVSTRPLADGSVSVSVGPSLGGFAEGFNGDRPWTLELPGFPALEAAEGVIASVTRDRDGLTRVLLERRAGQDRCEVTVRWGDGNPAGQVFRSLIGLEHRLELAARQLPAGHAQASALADLARKAGQAWRALGSGSGTGTGTGTGTGYRIETGSGNGNGNGNGNAAARPGLEDLKGQADAAVAELARDPRAEAALRVLAGLSLQALIVNDGSRHRLRVELYRESGALLAQVGPLRLRTRMQDGAWTTAILDPGADCVKGWDLNLALDRADLRWLHGELEAELELLGRIITLREPLSWDNRALRDWLVLGPLPEGEDPFVAAAAADGPRWRPLSMDPSRVARGQRHFHDLGDALFCPQGVVWARAAIEAPEPCVARFSLRHDGRAQVWVNGRLQEPGEDNGFSAGLQKGANAVLVRLTGVKAKGRGFILNVEGLEPGGAGTLRCAPPETGRFGRAGADEPVFETKR